MPSFLGLDILSDFEAHFIGSVGVFSNPFLISRPNTPVVASPQGRGYRVVSFAYRQRMGIIGADELADIF